MPPYPYQRVQDPLAIPSGYLQHEIRVQEKSQAAVVETGRPATNWTDKYVALGGIDTISSVYQNQANQNTSEVTHRITLRWPGEIGIVAGMRVRFGQDLQHAADIVRAVNVKMKNRVLLLDVVETDGGQ